MDKPLQSKPAREHQRSAYADAGVDIDAGNALVDMIKPIARSTARPGANPAIGGFGGLFDLKESGFNDPILVAANDGVGTKVKLAAETSLHDGIGIDLVAMCVNDLIVQGATPLFFLDYYATGKLVPATGAKIVQSIAEGCRQAGCALIGGETAEMPGLYQDQDYDLAGFAVGAVERGALLPRHDLTAGDVILGMASSGLHSNGFSLVRRILEQSDVDLYGPTPFPSTCPTTSLAQSLLTPTRIYVDALLATLSRYSGIKALAHITGGGLIDNIPRVLPETLAARIDLSQISVPPVFSWLAHQASLTQTDMLHSFNCGVGMVIIVAKEQEQQIAGALRAKGETIQTIGTLVNRGDEGDDPSQTIFAGSLAP